MPLQHMHTATALPFLQYANNVVQTGSPDDLSPLYPSSSLNGWGHVMLQQQQHESDISKQRSTQRDTDRQMLADVWQQSLYDDEGGPRDLANGYGAGLPGGQGLPAVPQPEEEEAEEEHEAGETFMVHCTTVHVLFCAWPRPHPCQTRPAVCCMSRLCSTCSTVISCLTLALDAVCWLQRQPTTATCDPHAGV